MILSYLYLALITVAGAFTPSYQFANRLKISKDLTTTFYRDYSKQHDEIRAKTASIGNLDMEQLVKPRPYPLFLAEKLAGILDNAFEGIQQKDGPHDDDDDDTADTKTREQIVVLGSGWGSASFIAALDPELYDIAVISPRNHFIFTPMLAGASVGSVEYRSICEPIRELNREARYLEAFATEIDTAKRTVTCFPVTCNDDDDECQADTEFTENYDRLVFAVGAKTNTFGIPGVEENCSFLKEISDARAIRAKLVNAFERANVPSLTDDERRVLLTFPVIGAGPAGVEFAAELRDFIEQDGPKYYPHLLQHVKIKVIEATNTVLAPFEESLQKEAIRQMCRPVKIKDKKFRHLLPKDHKLEELYLESPVKRVDKGTIFLDGGTEIEYGGLCVWAGGNGPLELTTELIDSLGDEQAQKQDVARGRIAVDRWMRAVGGDGRILALGDCSCVTEDQLPATGQVAAQQAEYVAELLNKKYNLNPSKLPNGTFLPPTRDPNRKESTLAETIASFSTRNSVYARPFQYLNLGILAYTGDETALAQVMTLPKAPAITSTGKMGNSLWQSVYLTKQISWRNRVLVLLDWFKRSLFGRDITQL